MNIVLICVGAYLIASASFLFGYIMAGIFASSAREDERMGYK